MESLLKLFLVLGAFFISTSAELPLADHAVYKIVSKLDGGVLTLSSNWLTGTADDAKIKVKDWNDTAGQKWKTKIPTLSKSYEFKPTLDDTIRLDADSVGSNVVGRVTQENTKYWYVKTVGEGSFQIKNYVTGTCITDEGINQKVKLMNCDNSAGQQWLFKQL